MNSFTTSVVISTHLQLQCATPRTKCWGRKLWFGVLLNEIQYQQTFTSQYTFSLGFVLLYSPPLLPFMTTCFFRAWSTLTLPLTKTHAWHRDFAKYDAECVTAERECS